MFLKLGWRGSQATLRGDTPALSPALRVLLLLSFYLLLLVASVWGHCPAHCHVLSYPSSGCINLRFGLESPVQNPMLWSAEAHCLPPAHLPPPHALTTPCPQEYTSLLNLQPDEQVLDVGCGIGGGDFYMARTYNCYVYGIDLSVNAVLSALERAAAMGNDLKVRCSSAVPLTSSLTPPVPACALLLPKCSPLKGNNVAKSLVSRISQNL